MALGVSCTGDKDKDVSLSLSTSMLNFEASVNAPQEVVVNAKNVGWSIEVSSVDNWITATVTGDKVVVTVGDRTRAEPRTGIIKVIPDSDKVVAKEITVTQKGSADPVTPEIVINPSALTFEGTDAPSQEVSVALRGEGFTWSPVVEKGKESWITVVAAEDKITVSVGNNPDPLVRTGKISIVSSDPKVESKTILVTQNSKVAPPSLSADKLTLNFTSRDTKSQLVRVTAVNCTYGAAARDANGQPVDWISPTKEKDGISVSVKSNGGAARTAFVVLTSSNSEVPDVKITVTQGEGSESVSTLTHDVEFTATKYMGTLYALNVWDTKATTASWVLDMFTDGVSYYRGGSMWPPQPNKFIGNGDRLYVEFSTPPIFIDEEVGEYFIPTEKDYTINIKTSYEQPNYPFTFISGRELYWVDPNNSGSTSRVSTRSVTPFGSWYYTIQNDEEVAAAPIVGGTMHFEKVSKYSYNVTINFVDDRDNKIDVHYSGRLDDIVQANSPMDPPGSGGGGDEDDELPPFVPPTE